MIHHLALRVADPEKARAFYGDLLGLAERRRVEDAHGLRAVWLDAGPVVLMLERELRGPGPGSGSGHLLALAVADLAPGRSGCARRGWRWRTAPSTPSTSATPTATAWG